MGKILPPGSFRVIDEPPAPTGGMADPAPSPRILKPGEFRPLTDDEKRARGLPVLGEDEGALTAGLRAAGNAAVFGFGDEIAGAGAGIGALFTPGASVADAYRKTRDEERRAQKSDELLHPTATTVGTVGGALASAALPGAGAGWVAKAGGLLGKMGRSAVIGAGYGAGAGIGGSEAKDTTGIALDAAKGAGVGFVAGGAIPAVVEGAKRVVGKVGDLLGKGQALAKDDAQALAVKKLIEARREGKEAFREAAQKYAPVMADEAEVATASAGGKGAEKVAKDAVSKSAWQKLIGDVTNKVKRDAGGPLAKNKPGMMRVLRNDGDFAAAVIGGEQNAESALAVQQSRKAKYGKALDDLYDRHQSAADAQATLDEYLEPLIASRNRYAKSPQTLKKAQAMDAEIERAKQVYGEKGTVSPAEMRFDYREAQNRGFGSGGEFSPSEVKALQREVSEGLRSVLHKKIEQSAAKLPGAEDDLQRLRLLNRKFSDYSRFDEILAQKVENLAMGTPPVGRLMALANEQGGWDKFAAKSAGKLVDPREWVSAAAGPVIKGARVVNREAQAAAARYKGNKIWEQAAKEVDDLTPGSAPLSGTAEPAASSAAAVPSLNERQLSAVKKAVAKGIPYATAVKLALGLIDSE